MNVRRWLVLVAALIAVLAGALWVKKASRQLAFDPPRPAELVPADTWAAPPILESPPTPIEPEPTAQDAGVLEPCVVAEGTAAAGPDAVVLEISPGFTAPATLTAHHGAAEALAPEYIIAISTMGVGTLRKHATPVTQSRVVLERCAGVSAWFEVLLDDGRYGRAPWTLDGSVVRILLREPARIRGRVLSNGVPVKGALVSMGLNIEAWSKADGSFEMVLHPEMEMGAALTVEDVHVGGKRLVGSRPELVIVGPGSKVEAGTLEMHPVSDGPRGTLGISWSFSGRGPVVEEVTPQSPAAQAGVRAGDLVVEVDGAAVQSIQQATARMFRGSGSSARLKVQRGKDFLLLDVSRKDDE